ncbi:MAG: hypothetical protein ACD_22C00204G0001 [uncultured bacterium]|nr:MAG: hypothetical protein ACD_22C00204G0001 [uncultured bacterium]
MMKKDLFKITITIASLALVFLIVQPNLTNNPAVSMETGAIASGVSEISSVFYSDLDANSQKEKITYYFVRGNPYISTFLRVENFTDGVWHVVWDCAVERDIFPQKTFLSNQSGEIVGFIALPRSSIGIVVKTSVQGSGGFTGYKVIAKKAGQYIVIYEQTGLKNGDISIGGGGKYIQEVQDSPLPSDSNCCASRVSYRMVSFLDNYEVTTNEVVVSNYWMDLINSSPEESTNNNARLGGDI